MVIDKDPDKIKEFREYTDNAFIVSSLDTKSLLETGIQNVDVAVVCIGEQLDDNDLAGAFRDAEISDILLVLGSSLTVSPVSSLPMAARINKRMIVIVNKQPTPFDRDAAFRFDDIALFCGEMEKYFLSK